MDPYASDPRLAAAATCPRCSAAARAGTAAVSICCECGLSWKIEVPDVPSDRAMLDMLEARTLPVGQLRRYLQGETS